MVLGPMARYVAQGDGAGIGPPGSGVVGHAVENLELDGRVIDADTYELKQILRVYPYGKAAAVDGLQLYITNAQASCFDSEFVCI